MIRGIFILTQSKYGFILSELLEGVDIRDYVWAIDHKEVYSPDTDHRFDQETLCGESFAEAINTPPEYLLHMGEFKAFQKESDMVKVETYSDFISSNCQIIILVADSRFIDIYAKDISVLEIIKENANKYGCEKTEYISADNDERRFMHV